MRMHLERLHQLMAQNVSDSPGYTATEHIGLHFISPPERSDFRPMKAGCDVSDYFGVV